MGTLCQLKTLLPTVLFGPRALSRSGRRVRCNRGTFHDTRCLPRKAVPLASLPIDHFGIVQGGAYKDEVNFSREKAYRMWPSLHQNKFKRCKYFIDLLRVWDELHLRPLFGWWDPPEVIEADNDTITCHVHLYVPPSLYSLTTHTLANLRSGSLDVVKQ